MTESKAAEATNGQKPRRDPNAVQSRLLGAMRGHEVRIHLGACVEARRGRDRLGG